MAMVVNSVRMAWGGCEKERMAGKNKETNGGGSTSLPAFVSTELELGGGRSLWWLQETLGIILYFSIS
jgi:hypothetical protein